jgi:hypothetical protein
MGRNLHWSVKIQHWPCEPTSSRAVEQLLGREYEPFFQTRMYGIADHVGGAADVVMGAPPY